MAPYYDISQVKHILYQAGMAKNNPQRVYLITYSNLNVQKFPTRESFGRACATAFGGNKVLYFACSKEEHQSGQQHYHVSIRLNQSQRWLHAKKYLEANHGIVANFSPSPNGGMYAGAYHYAAKTDTGIFQGNCLEKHPDLANIGKNSSSYTYAANANAAYRTKRKSINASKVEEQPESSKTVKQRRLDKLDVVDFCREKGIKTAAALMAAAEIRREAGDRELARYIVQIGPEARSQLVEDAWQMHNSVAKQKELSRARMDIVREFKEEKACECEGVWLNCALDVLKKNNINKYAYADAIRTLLDKGRGKHRNIILVGEHDCAKTFLLDPLTTVFPHTFSNPASSGFSWLGVDTAQTILLNDFRWKPLSIKGGVIEWDTFLRMLEGAETNLPAPMNAFSKHICLSSDIPIFATSSSEVKFYINHPDEPQNKRHATENGMMESRWKVFNLYYEFKESEKVLDIPKCGHCFAELVLMGAD